VTSDQVFIGIGLTLALAVGSQMAGRWPGHDLLFRVRADSRLEPVTERAEPAVEDGDTTVILGPALRTRDEPSAAARDDS
jgi:hypothetical protein